MTLTVEQLMNVMVKCLTDGSINAQTAVTVESNVDSKGGVNASTVSLETDLFTGVKRIVVRA
jgi:hypothetical protein